MLVKGDDMAKQNISDANAALAYKFWRARCFHDGSPEEDLFRAVCANSMKVGVRQPPSKRTATKAKAMGASVYVGA
jgi:hypothetical protein